MGRRIPAVVCPWAAEEGGTGTPPAVNALKQHPEPVQPEIRLLLQPRSGAISHLSVQA